jgi:hypothetical protein
MTKKDFHLKDVFRSDKLPALLNLAKSISALSPFMRDFVKFRIVLDASAAQEHLRWLLGKRTNPSATTSIHEAIVSGVVVAFAPSYIEGEILEHEEEIATDTGATTVEVRRLWLVMRKSLQLYPMDAVPKEVRQLVDHDDEPYRIVRQEIGARAILTRDPHFRKMGEPVVMEQIDVALRDYARASTVKIGVVLGSGMAFTISFEMVPVLFRMLKGVAGWMKRQSPTTQVAIICGVLILAIHPKSRAKFVSAWQAIAPVISDFAMKALTTIVLEAAQATRDSAGHLRTIEAALPPPAKTTLIMHARAVSIMAKGPLSLVEFERRIQQDGYKPRSSNSSVYLRRVLLKAPDFVQVAPGRWIFKPFLRQA